MVKKLLTFILGLGLAAGASATINFPASSVQYWVGTGSNSAVVVVAWDDAATPTALAWGVRWNGTVSALDLIDSIQTYDSRFSNGSSATAASVTYNDGTVVLTSDNNWWCYTVNGAWATVGYTGYYMSDGDIMELSGSCYFSMTSAVAATDPNPAPGPAPALCDSVHALPYAQVFSDCPAGQSPARADAPVPECWAIFSNGRYTRDTTPNAYIYYGGMATSYSTNNYGCVTANDPFFCLIACQTYTGTSTGALNDMLDFGTCKYAVLPPFDQPLSQTRLVFDYRTSNTGALLLLGYVVNDTADFVVLDSMPSDYRVLHQMNLRLDSLDAAIPDNARLAFCWKSTSTSSSYPSNIYVGIDNLTVSLISSDPGSGPTPAPDPVDATIAFSDILYWVGSGSDRAALIVNYGQPDTAFAWGFLFNGTTTAQAMLDSIAAADPRFWYVGSPSMGGDIHFILNNGDTLGLSPVGALGYNFWWANLNGRSAGAGIGATLHNGYVFKYGDLNSAIGWDTLGGNCMEEAWIKAPTPVSVPDTTPILDTIVPPPSLVDATVDFADITCWAGSGPDSTALIVSFANPDTAFAWGVLINGTTTSADMLDAVMAVDTNLSITDHPDWGDGQIRYRLADGTVISRIGTQWLFNINGVDAWGDDDVMAGDVFKFGDAASGIQVGTFQRVWTVEPTIVNFCDTTPAIDTTTPVTPAPVEATIAASDILYWVGEGSNQVVLAVNWADTALAWGYRFSTESVTVATMMADIAAADPRFSYTGSGYISDILYIDTAAGMTDTLRGSSYWESKRNGVTDAGMAQSLVDGDFEKWGTPAAGVVVDSTYWGDDWGWGYTYVYPMAITPVSVPDTAGTTPAIDTTTPVTPTPVEATIAASDILYWVGEGSNRVVLAVNWADTALAWGYRFSTESVTVATMMADIAAADPRFSYTGSGYISDILYIDTAAGMTDTLRGSSYWESKRNGVTDAGMAQSLVDGDFEKWGTPAAGVVVDSTYWGDDWGWGYTYVYPMAITPVSVPDTAGTTPVDPQPEHGPFCGAAGTEGSDAIAADSSAIVAWATACTLELGPQDISVPGSPTVSYPPTGDAAGQAVGPCSMTDNLSVVSLGDGGSATLTFAKPIRNGEGPDFAVFENSFNDTFLELAFVEVSSDGERFVRFPATSLTQTETQATTIDPTFINNLAGKYRSGYGTPFDLEELRDSTGINIDSIVYVRVVDVVGSIDPRYATYDAFGHIVNDPWPTNSYSGGFDLDGVAVIYQAEDTQGIVDAEVLVSGLWPNPAAETLNVSLQRAAEAELYDLTGRRVAAYSLAAGRNILDLTGLPTGVYMLRVEGSVSKIVKQ